MGTMWKYTENKILKNPASTISWMDTVIYGKQEINTIQKVSIPQTLI